MTRAQIKDATKRSATGGTGNITTPHTQLQTIQQQHHNATKITNLMNSGSSMLGVQVPGTTSGGVKNMRTLQPNTHSKVTNAQQ